MRVEGIEAIVTGGSSGLGAAVAQSLAARGARVAVLDLNEPPRSSGAEMFVRADMSRSDEITSAVKAIVEGIGVPRIVVNCAGIGEFIPTVGADGPAGLAHFVRAISVNLLGTYDLIRQTAFLMARETPLDDERGVIVNTASIAAFDGIEGQAAYAASKAAIVGMTLPIARDLAVHRIRVNSIAPGVFRTGLLVGLPKAVEQHLARQTPFPSRMGDPAEFASLVLHIVDNRMMNGETIRLDAGLRMSFEHRA